MAKKEIQRVEKPWGYELIWAKTGDYVGKMLFIKKGHQLSLQYHEKKEETIIVHSGQMRFVFEEAKGQAPIEIILNPGDAHHIPTGRIHRMIAAEDCTVFEVSTPHLDDVIRLEDGYGRVGTSAP